MSAPALPDLPPADGVQSLASLAKADGVRFLLATFTTLTGKPCAKLVPVQAADALEHEGVGFAGYAAGGMGQHPRDPDLVARPDKASYTPLPFVREGLAMVHCDPHVDGVPYRFAPRVILKAALARARAKGFDLVAGAEIEYFLVKRASDGSVAVADPLDAAAQPCYDARGVTRMYDHLTAVSDAMVELGWSPYASDHEDGNGQFEQNFTHADALVTADRVVTLRYLIQVLAERRGMTATFMPKPFADRTGNGMHLHLSLWNSDEPLFPGAGSLGLAPLAEQFVGGLLDHAPALHALVAPTVNSYKRTGATTTTSGAAWAPTLATHGGNDRTHMVRVPDGHRVELRAGDGAASSHLALAATLGAGLDGIDRGLDPAEVGGRKLPRTLLDAVHALEGDDVLRGILDGAGPGVSDYYVDLKREEFYAWHSAVTPWEVEHYLTAV